MVLLIILIIHS